MAERPSLAHAVLALPLVLVSAAVVWLSLSERAGGAPLSSPAPRNIAEAAAMRDPATVLRLLRGGSDPTAVYPLRPEVISSSIRRATALEAALWARQIEMVRLLDREGAIPDGDVRRHLGCLAFDLDLEEVVDYLAPGEPCAPGAAVRRVAARSRSRSGEQHE